MGAGFIQIRACHLKRKADTHRLEPQGKRLAVIFAKIFQSKSRVLFVRIKRAEKARRRFGENKIPIAVNAEISEISGSANVHKRMTNSCRWMRWKNSLNMSAR
jgi:hypothetical protein